MYILSCLLWMIGTVPCSQPLLRLGCDRCVVCGSANINDRSQEGERDSEVCLLVGDLDMDQGDDQVH